MSNATWLGEIWRRGWVLACLLAWLGGPWSGGALPRALGAQAGLDDAWDLVVCDSSGDRVLRFSDLDGSGDISPDVPGEITVFYDDASSGPDLSTPAHLAPGPDGEVFLLDGGTLDQVLVLADRNGDGDANDAGEIGIWYEGSEGRPALATPNALVPAADGSWYIADDGARAQRIVRIEDLDADGSALDEGESTVAYDASALSVPFLEDVRALACDGEGRLYAGDSTLQALFVLEDGDADGAFLGAAEVRPYFRGSLEAPVGRVESVVSMDGVLFSCDRELGRILRLEDLDGDGDAEEAGEASIFFDASLIRGAGDVTDFVPRPEGGFLLLANESDAILLLDDANGDGDVLDDGEVTPWLLDGGSTLSLPSGLAFIPRREITPPVGEPFLRGDASADGKIDVSDPIAALGFLFLGAAPPACRDALDVDDNGELNISDAIASLNYLFLGGRPPLPPFPDPGTDPTPDSLDC